MAENPLQELMTRGESGTAGYNAYNRGTYVGSDGKEHARGHDRPIDFTGMTIRELQRLQHLPRSSPERVFAVGKYQIIPDTLDGAIRALHIDPEQHFTPELQDRVLWQHLIVEKRPDIAGYITGKPGVTLRSAQYALACEWASFADPTRGGRGHYGGANHASITLSESAAALNAMRHSYGVAIEQGRTPQQAWAAVTSGPAVHDQSVARHSGSTPGVRTHGTETAMADGVLTRGETGADVRALQVALDRLGYRDANGRVLAYDGVFGKSTAEALQAFQKEHKLHDKGTYGPLSQKAVHDASTHLVTSEAHPQHSVYAQVLRCVHAAERARGTPTGPHSERIAAALTTELVREGITHVDRVEFNHDRSLVRAVQVSPLRDEPGLNRHTDAISAPQASMRSIAESSRQIHEVAVNVQAQRQDPQFVEDRAPAASARAPAIAR